MGSQVEAARVKKALEKVAAIADWKYFPANYLCTCHGSTDGTHQDHVTIALPIFEKTVAESL